MLRIQPAHLAGRQQGKFFPCRGLGRETAGKMLKVPILPPRITCDFAAKMATVRPSARRKTILSLIGSFRGAGFAREPGTQELRPARIGVKLVFMASGPGPQGPSRNDDLVGSTNFFASVFRAGVARDGAGLQFRGGCTSFDPSFEEAQP
jgi:hypothetical protein